MRSEVVQDCHANMPYVPCFPYVSCYRYIHAHVNHACKRTFLWIPLLCLAKNAWSSLDELRGKLSNRPTSILSNIFGSVQEDGQYHMSRSLISERLPPQPHSIRSGNDTARVISSTSIPIIVLYVVKKTRTYSASNGYSSAKCSTSFSLVPASCEAKRIRIHGFAFI